MKDIQSVKIPRCRQGAQSGIKSNLSLKQTYTLIRTHTYRCFQTHNRVRWTAQSLYSLLTNPCFPFTSGTKKRVLGSIQVGWGGWWWEKACTAVKLYLHKAISEHLWVRMSSSNPSYISTEVVGYILRRDPDISLSSSGQKGLFFLLTLSQQLIVAASSCFRKSKDWSRTVFLSKCHSAFLTSSQPRQRFTFTYDRCLNSPSVLAWPLCAPMLLPLSLGLRPVWVL